MDGRRRLLCAWMMIAGMACCAGGCASFERPRNDLAGVPTMPPSPTLEQIIQAVNSNSSQIQSLSANQATLSVAEFPSLRANIVFERARRFRLRAEISAFTGPEVDLGSNEDLFWVWVKRTQPPTLYFCRHDQFAASPARRMIPIEPLWLIEALGINEFDPALPHQVPFPRSAGQLEIRTPLQTPEGPKTKITVVEAARGLVLGQYVYDQRGQLSVAAVASRHRRDPLSNRIVPRIVDISCPSAQFAMRLDLGNAEVNRPLGNRAELFSMPSYPGWQMLDLGNPGLQFPPAQATMGASYCVPCRNGWAGWR